MTNPELLDLKHQAQNNTYTTHGDISEADCVLGFSFGYVDDNGKILPGKSNEQLAQYIDDTFPNKPLILQFEIADAIQKQEPALVIRESRTKGEYLNSIEIAEQALIFMIKNGWKKAAIVTHPAMEARNDAICKELGMITILPPGLDSIEYDVNSVQSWTRDKESWWKREEQVIDKCYEEGWI